jgi:hypothetical protein
MARVALVVPDLMLGSRIQELLKAGGHELVREEADVLVVDLMADCVDVSAHAAGPEKTLGVFAHTQPDVRERALAAGFDLAVPRSRMVREGAALVTQLAAAD